MSDRLGPADESRRSGPRAGGPAGANLSAATSAAGGPATARTGNFADDPHWRDLVLFHEYFHGDTGQGLGASHQTGWTALVARLLEDSAAPAGSAESARPEPVATS